MAVKRKVTTKSMKSPKSLRAANKSQIFHCKKCRKHTRHDVTPSGSGWVMGVVRTYVRERECALCGNIVNTYEIHEEDFHMLIRKSRRSDNLEVLFEEYRALVKQRDKVDKQIATLLKNNLAK